MTNDYLNQLVESGNFSTNELKMLNAYTSTIGANFGDVVGKYVFETLSGYSDGIS